MTESTRRGMASRRREPAAIRRIRRTAKRLGYEASYIATRKPWPWQGSIQVMPRPRVVLVVVDGRRRPAEKLAALRKISRVLRRTIRSAERCPVDTFQPVTAFTPGEEGALGLAWYARLLARREGREVRSWRDAGIPHLERFTRFRLDEEIPWPEAERAHRNSLRRVRREMRRKG